MVAAVGKVCAGNDEVGWEGKRIRMGQVGYEKSGRGKGVLGSRETDHGKDVVWVGEKCLEDGCGCFRWKQVVGRKSVVASREQVLVKVCVDQGNRQLGMWFDLD